MRRLPRRHQLPHLGEHRAEHGRRGRRVEYTIGWPLDERTMAGIEHLRESDWGAALDAEGEVDPAAQVADPTGILRHDPDGDRLASWPRCMRLIVRRTPRPATKPAKLGEHPDFEYGAFVTNTPDGQIQFLDARHRTQAHVEDRIKQFKACGAADLPSIDYDRNAAWLQLTALATSLTAWLRHLGLDGELAKASTKTLRFRTLSAPARLITHAQHRILKIHPAGHGPPTWPPPASPAPSLTPQPPSQPPSQHPAGRGTRCPPEHPRAPRMPTTALPPQK